jgi:lysosomal alpha-glucosidase
MNEIAGFCNGDCSGIPRNVDKLNNPPYLPTEHKIYFKTLFMDSKNSLTTQYNSHNLYGHFEAISTYNMMLKYQPNKRPFIITRSSFPGTGKFAGKWSGDNFSTWKDLHLSISFLFTFNMFGIPFNGADICVIFFFYLGISR